MKPFSFIRQGVILKVDSNTFYKYILYCYTGISFTFGVYTRYPTFEIALRPYIVPGKIFMFHECSVKKV